MPLNHNNYNHRGGGNYGIVLCCPNIAGPNRRVYFDHNRNRGSWVIRDFLSNQRLDNEHSSLQVADIEADAIYDEFPAWCNVENNPDQWTSYLNLRSTAVFRTGGPLGTQPVPDAASGSWQPIG